MGWMLILLAMCMYIASEVISQTVTQSEEVTPTTNTVVTVETIAGEPFSLWCNFSTSRNLSALRFDITWVKDGVPWCTAVPGNVNRTTEECARRGITLDNVYDPSGTQNFQLNIPTANMSDSGNYTCSMGIQGEEDKILSQTRTTVLVNDQQTLTTPNTTSRASITSTSIKASTINMISQTVTQSEEVTPTTNTVVTVETGEPFSLWCNFSTSRNLSTLRFDITWVKDGVPWCTAVPGNVNRTTEECVRRGITLNNVNNTSGTQNFQLNIPTANITNSGNYTCSMGIQGEEDEIISSTRTYVLVHDQRALTTPNTTSRASITSASIKASTINVISQTVTQSEEVTPTTNTVVTVETIAGEPFSLWCNFSTSRNLTALRFDITWVKDGVPWCTAVPGNVNGTTEECVRRGITLESVNNTSGTQDFKLNIPKANISDSGNYSCFMGIQGEEDEIISSTRTYVLVYDQRALTTPNTTSRASITSTSIEASTINAINESSPRGLTSTGLIVIVVVLTSLGGVLSIIIIVAFVCVKMKSISDANRRKNFYRASDPLGRNVENLHYADFRKTIS